MITEESSALLGAADIRRIAASTGINPTKRFGQNFVVDPGTVRRIARLGDLGPDSRVIEVGPGLGSLTLALLETGAQVLAVEIDPRLADLLPSTVRAQMPQAMSRFHLIREDALQLGLDQVEEIFGSPLPQLTLMSNLPYNVATPIILTLLERFPSLASFTVMVQKEVADRLTAQPGSKIYGVPSVKLAWYGQAKPAGIVGASVFWPAPHVDSALVAFTRYDQGQGPRTDLRERTFTLVDAAFSQRRKTLHAALKKMVPTAAFEKAGIDPTRRGETLTMEEFTRLASAWR
ncbi:dimethyladenosine transferase [Parascardovia denticolens DSM 10105 = JCM 12538]|nr:dimethyladenosine transferase [Parascardovia denticolens F0305]BAR06053.1 dimethyladenosine transferase [Parascardovia denticolens DSM 10105 = JCM 12538]